jgi:hypothetical protein
MRFSRIDEPVVCRIRGGDGVCGETRSAIRYRDAGRHRLRGSQVAATVSEPTGSTNPATMFPPMPGIMTTARVNPAPEATALAAQKEPVATAPALEAPAPTTSSAPAVSAAKREPVTAAAEKPKALPAAAPRSRNA